jgi:uncharacterized phiE125 gp8 family phage protein
MGTVLIEAPASQPVSVAEAKQHCRVVVDNDDAYIGALIDKAVAYVEDQIGRALISQKYKHTLIDFPRICSDVDGLMGLYLKPTPLLSVESVKYIDVDGNEITLENNTDYVVDIYSTPGRIVPAYQKSWPSVRYVPNAVAIEFTAGYGGVENVPSPIKQGVLMLVASWYDARAAVSGIDLKELPRCISAEAVIAPYKVWGF